MSTKPRTLFLVRHGLPDYRGGKAGDEWPGPPLSDIGRQQAAQAAAALEGCGAVAVHSSPLMRTHTTAEIVGRRLGVPVGCDSDLREWHRTETLFQVSERLTRWLVRWLRGPESCAIAVSHASPLLAILRSALYVPQVRWHKPGRPEALELSTADRFEVSMASVFQIDFERDVVTAVCRFHPEPRVLHLQRGRPQARLPRPVPGHGENECLCRPNYLRLLGYCAGRRE